VRTLHRILAGTAVLGLGVATAVACAPTAVPGPRVPVTASTGTLADGATWTVETPAAWNGTLLLYSHGTVLPGAANPAVTAPDRFTGNVLLERGYALAGTSYAGTGWAVEEALDDQIAVLDTLPTPPREVLAWGSSLGGLVTAELVEQHPDRIAGALPMCGVLAGGVRLWDTYQDMQSALPTLLGRGAFLRAAGPAAAAGRLRSLLDAAQETPQGRARIALVAALGDLPGWAGAGTPRPTGPTEREAADYATLRDQLVELMVFGRAELRQRAGGNPSSTSGAARFRDAARRDDVARLYADAGLDLAADLGRLDAAPPVTADPAARAYLARFGTPTGALHGRPVLTLHTTGDGLAVPSHETAYAAEVHDGALAQAFVERAGHCLFSTGELVAAVDELADRVHTGRSGPFDPAALAARARALGPERNVHVDEDGTLPVEPGFVAFTPGPFPGTTERSTS
jgi:pimeloyl-ACP methyl ester carboxylesterase